MLEDIKNTLKQSAIYGLSRVSIKLVGFILFPLYSIYFTVDQYGIIVRGEIFWQLIQTFLLYSIETAILRWYHLIGDPQEKKRLIFTVFSFLFILNFFFLIASFLFKTPLSILLFNESSYDSIVILCITTAMLETLLGIPLVILRIKEQAGKYASIILLETIISLVLQVYFITSTNDKLNGIFISKSIASFVALFVLSPILLKASVISIHFPILREILKFSFPLMIASFVSSLLNTQDRYILGFLMSSKEVGLYGLGFNIAGILTFLFISPFALAFPPIFWKKADEENSARFMTKLVTYSFFAFVYGALILSLAAPHFIKIFARNPDYWPAKNVVPIISYALVFYGMQIVGFMSFYYHKKTSIVLVILLISALINAALNGFLIPILGIYGSAISSFISFFISIILIYRLSRKYYFIKWEVYKLSISMVLAILLTLPFYLIHFENLLLNLVFSSITIIAYPFLLYFLKFYEEIELKTIRNYFFKHINR